MNSPPTNAVQGRTAHDIIAMFGELGLPVCDEPALIKQKFEGKTRNYLRLTGSTSPREQLSGKTHIDNGTALMKELPALLNIVEGFFKDLAKGVIASSVGKGENTLTAQLVQALTSLARTQCRVDDKLAQRYIDGLGMKVGQTTTRSPATVTKFEAVPGLGRITLNWDVPTQHCEHVEICREGRAQPIFRGRETSCVDRDVKAGETYRYIARCWFEGFSGVEAPASAVCLGEVSAASGVWNGRTAELSWRPATQHVEAIIFRSRGKAPRLAVVDDEPSPVDSNTQQVWRGEATSWKDSTVQEGETYHYRIVSHFGGGHYTDGVGVQVTIPRPPTPPSKLTARFESHAGQNVVQLDWPALGSGLAVDYVVVRREGAVAPTQLDDGEVIETQQNGCLDANVRPGRRYVYAVFSRVGGLCSRTAATSPPVDILPDVTQLTAKTGDSVVELTWQVPLGATRVRVARSLNPPARIDDGVTVALAYPDRAQDTGVKNGRRYHYLVCCAYKPDGQTEMLSQGLRIDAQPDRLPVVITDFEARPRGHEVVCSWQPPPFGEAAVLRSEKSHGLNVGHRLAAGDLKRLGQPVAGKASGEAIDPVPSIAQPYYSIFTLAGSHAIAGPEVVCAICRDVSSLRLSTTRDGVRLSWRWPADCISVHIVRLVDDWPQGVADPRATVQTCSLAQYHAAGGQFIDRVQIPRARLHYVVYAQASGAPGQFFAPGMAPDCRGVVDWTTVWMTLRYRFETTTGPSAGRAIRLKWQIEDPNPSFGGFVIVAARDGIPASAAEGVELYRWIPSGQAPAATWEDNVPLQAAQARGWPWFHCRAFALDPAQSASTMFIHPRLHDVINNRGIVPAPAKVNGQRFYREGVPEKFICPYCFGEFPVADIWFAHDSALDKRVQVRRGLFSRLRKSSFGYPTNDAGQIMSIQFCPQTDPFAPCKDRPLPMLTGSHASIVVGLIGAKYSGKSHYIATLIERLRTRVGRDMSGAAYPCDQATRERYQREFQGPLFDDRFELPVTAGTSPPLIYRFDLDNYTADGGRQQEPQRRVTLAFYDTAGENLHDVETVRRVVQYVGVASGMIFLIDPLQIRQVREKVPKGFNLPQLDPASDPNTMLAVVIEALNRARGGTAEKLDTPVAVALTKCDVLRDARLIEANRLWNTDARHQGFFDEESADDMAAMMAEYVQRWAPDVYQTVRTSFRHHAFFGISATGCAADPATKRYPLIAPWRVEDPLLWLLHEAGVIPSNPYRHL